jgi:hypothetical protein
MLRRVLHAGIASAAISTAAALAFSRWENGRATPAINAVSHMVWGGKPPADIGRGGRNLALGACLHTGANIFWASVFEWVYGRTARASPASAWLGGLSIALLGFVVDYALVPRRLRPGMEAYLSRVGLLGVYAAVGAGLAWSAIRNAAAGTGARSYAGPMAAAASRRLLRVRGEDSLP